MVKRRSAPIARPMHPRDLHILLVLAGGPLHGYAIVRQVETQSEGRMRLDPANLYRTLAKLALDDLIQQVDVDDAPDDARQRRFYALTRAGSAALQAEVDRMRSLTALADARLGKLETRS